MYSLKDHILHFKPLYKKSKNSDSIFSNDGIYLESLCRNNKISLVTFQIRVPKVPFRFLIN